MLNIYQYELELWSYKNTKALYIPETKKKFFKKDIPIGYNWLAVHLGQAGNYLLGTYGMEWDGILLAKDGADLPFSSTRLEWELENDQSKIMQDKFVQDIIKRMSQEFERVCYERYKLQWMIDHGYSLDYLMRKVDETQDDMIEQDECGPVFNPDIELVDIFHRWELDNGFNGSIWACRAEFLETEYQDEGYMEHLLGVGSKEFRYWKNCHK